MARTRFSNRRRLFFEIPQRVNLNSDNDTITSSVVAWSFYPKLLVRDGKGFRNVGNNQSINLHPTSVNKGHSELKWLSYYHIMQSKQYVALEDSGSTVVIMLTGFIMPMKQQLLKNLRLPCYVGTFVAM